MSGVKVGIGPDLLTHGLGSGVNLGPLPALTAFGASVSTCIINGERNVRICFLWLHTKM